MDRRSNVFGLRSTSSPRCKRSTSTVNDPKEGEPYQNLWRLKKLKKDAGPEDARRSSPALRVGLRGAKLIPGHAARNIGSGRCTAFRTLQLGLKLGYAAFKLTQTDGVGHRLWRGHNGLSVGEIVMQKRAVHLVAGSADEKHHEKKDSDKGQADTVHFLILTRVMKIKKTEALFGCLRSSWRHSVSAEAGCKCGRF
jgi:hypothetical protein